MAVIRVNGTSTGNFPTGGDVSGEISLSNKSINDLSDVNTTGVANGKILKYDSSTSKFIIGQDTDTGISNVLEDTTPQLGGDLDINAKKFTNSGAGSFIFERSSTSETAGVVVASKNVGGSGDLTHRVPYFFNITDGSASHTFANIHARREGTSERYITLSTFDDDTTNRKDVLEVFRTSADKYGATLSGTLDVTGAAGEGDVVDILGDYTGSAGNVANAADVLVVTKKHNTTSRLTGIKFKSADSSNTHHNHSITSRRTGTGVNDKFFQIFEHDDDNSDQPVELVKFKKNLAFTTSNNLAELQMTGRINLTVSDADAMPNSNRTTVSMDGTTTTSHNMLTGMADFGTSSMTDGAEITFTGDITNDAIGGASSPRRIGQIVFHYGNTETDNAVMIESQEHDQTLQTKFTVDGHRAKVDTKPIGLANLTTTQRNALTAANGDVIYNTTDSKIQAYAGGSWVNLH